MLGVLARANPGFDSHARKFAQAAKTLNHSSTEFAEFGEFFNQELVYSAPGALPRAASKGASAVQSPGAASHQSLKIQNLKGCLLKTNRLLKNSDFRLLKKISEARRAKNRRAEAYLAGTLERED